MIKPFSFDQKQKGQHRGWSTGLRKPAYPKVSPMLPNMDGIAQKKRSLENVDAYLLPEFPATKPEFLNLQE